MKSPENKIGQVNGVAATKAAPPKALRPGSSASRKRLRQCVW